MLIALFVLATQVVFHSNDYEDYQDRFSAEYLSLAEHSTQFMVGCFEDHQCLDSQWRRVSSPK